MFVPFSTALACLHEGAVPLCASSNLFVFFPWYICGFLCRVLLPAHCATQNLHRTHEDIEDDEADHDTSAEKSAEQPEETKTLEPRAREEKTTTGDEPSTQESEKQVATASASSVVSESDSKPEGSDASDPAAGNKDPQTKPDST